jgi:hypothetical protein
MYSCSTTEWISSQVFSRVSMNCVMKWNDKALTSQYYWGLKNTIKNEIVRMNWSENLQKWLMSSLTLTVNSEMMNEMIWTSRDRCEQHHKTINMWWFNESRYDQQTKVNSVKVWGRLRENNRASWKRVFQDHWKLESAITVK